jgi:hypothetical protein
MCEVLNSCEFSYRPGGRNEIDGIRKMACNVEWKTGYWSCDGAAAAAVVRERIAAAERSAIRLGGALVSTQKNAAFFTLLLGLVGGLN